MEETVEASTNPDPPAASPLRKRGRPRDRTADGRILAAAADLFFERGYDAMTIDAVAVRAHVGKATVYRRWASKEDLAAAAIRHLYAADRPMPDHGSLRADLVWAYTALLEFAGAPSGRRYLQTALTESVRDPRVARVHRLAVEALERRSAVIFERAVRRGEIAPGPAPAWTMQWVVGLVVAAVATGTEQPTPGDAERLALMAISGIGGG